MADDIHNYNGVCVSGSHLVKEDEIWMRVKDAEGAILLENKTPTRVYIIGCENHILETYNGDIYSDYFETHDAELLVNYQEDFMNYYCNREITKNDARKDILNNEN